MTANSSDKSDKPLGSIDNRGESTRRYGKLEPEGYSRHAHGNLEGEYQKGQKDGSAIPVETQEVMGDKRYRKDNLKSDPNTIESGYGGKTFDADVGDKDMEELQRAKILAGAANKKPK